MASICCSPPDSVPARWRLPLAQAREDREHALAVLRAARACPAVAAELEVLAHAHVGEDAAALRHVDQAARDDRRRRARVDRLAGEADRAAPRRAARPEIARLSVDLPAPFEPSTATISPSLDREVDAAQDSVAP